MWGRLGGGKKGEERRSLYYLVQREGGKWKREGMPTLLEGGGEERIHTRGKKKKKSFPFSFAIKKKKRRTKWVSPPSKGGTRELATKRSRKRKGGNPLTSIPHDGESQQLITVLTHFGRRKKKSERRRRKRRREGQYLSLSERREEKTARLSEPQDHHGEGKGRKVKGGL